MNDMRVSLSSMLLVLAVAAASQGDEAAESVRYVGTRDVCLSPLSDANRTFKTRTYEVSPASLGDELVGYLKEIDGHEWRVSQERFDGDGILLALSNSPLVSADDRRKLEGLSQEGYVIVADQRSIRLVGNSVLALQHAMFDLLERLGCRFLTPSEAWTIIPDGTGLKLTAGTFVEEPDYVSRQAFFTGGGAEGWSDDGSLKEIGEACRQWDRATRQGAYSSLGFGHTWGSIIRRNRQEFVDHPEYFRINEEGERESFDNHPRGENPPPEAMHFCVSNPGLMALCVQDRIALLEKTRESTPTQNLVSMDPNDGHRPCHCDNCKALGNPSDRVYHLANHVAREIRTAHPDAQVGMMIYTPFDTPPLNTRVEPNVVTLMALAFNRSGLSYDQLARGWVKAGATKMLVYPYYGIVQWTNAMPAGSPTFDRISRDIPFFHRQWNVVATLQETGSTWARMGPAMYLARKLLWDVDADSQAIYDGYFHDAFGSGADEMRELYDLWDTEQGAKLTDTNIARWLTLAQRAIEATDNESAEVKRRVDDILAYLHYTTLFHHASKARSDKGEARFLAAMEELFSFNWRIRRRHVVQTWGSMYFLFQWLNPHFKENWRHHSNYNTPGYEKSSPWMIQAQKEGKAVWQQNGDDVTSAEIRVLFTSDLATFSSRIAANRQFSRALVPLFPGAAVEPNYRPVNGGLIRRLGRWHIHIEKQTSLKITFNTAVHSTEKDRPGHVHEARLTDSDGSVVFSKEPAPYAGGNGQADVSLIELELEPGLYHLEARGGWNSPFRPVFSPAVKYVHEQSPEYSTITHYYTPGYFYVPKGTKELRFNNNGYLTIKAPSWAKAKTFDVKTSPGLNTIPVADDDGAVWELRHVSTGAFQLLNVPPFISTARENMLVPKEVLETDGNTLEPRE